MFRESDYVPPRMHQTFLDRKVPEMQRRGQVARFDDVPERRPSYNLSEADIVVPVTHDTQYNPNHPEADWGGLVSKDRLQRRHTNEHRSQQTSIIQQEDGIVSKPGYEVEFKHRSVQSKPQSTSSLIGGISAGGDQYRTTTQRLQSHEGNTRDQMILKKRIGSKKSLDPQYVPSFQDSQQHQNRDVYNSVPFAPQNVTPTDDYTHSAVGVGGRNFTANIGASLVSRIPDKPSSTRVDPNDYTKTMLSQNHKPLPGYTGNRKW